MLSSLAKRYNWSQTLDSIRKELKSWRTLKKTSLNRGSTLKKPRFSEAFFADQKLH